MPDAVTAAPVALEIRPIAGALGAEISGIDLSEDLSDDAVAALRRAWLEHLVLFFHDQPLTPAGFLRFARRLGEPMEYPFVKGLDECPEVIPVVKLAHERVNFGGIWHSDTAYLGAPPMASLLIARELPPAGGDTLFANMYQAYEALSGGMKRLLHDLVGVNSSATADATRTREDRMKDSGRTADRQGYTAEHPVVRVHPETGRRALYVKPGAHRAVRGDDARGERADPPVPVPAPGQAGVHVPVPLAPGLHRPVGQPVRPAQRDQRLSRSPPGHAPHHPGRRRAEGTRVGVEMTMARNPLRRSQRAELPHWARALGDDAEPRQGIGVTDARRRQPALKEPPHPLQVSRAVWLRRRSVRSQSRRSGRWPFTVRLFHSQHPAGSTRHTRSGRCPTTS
jgi:taurine dioxygenase